MNEPKFEDMNTMKRKFIYLLPVFLLLALAACSQHEELDTVPRTDIPSSELETQNWNKESFLSVCEGKIYETGLIYYCKRVKGEIEYYVTGKYDGEHYHHYHAGVYDECWGADIGLTFEKDKVHHKVIGRRTDDVYSYDFDEKTNTFSLDTDHKASLKWGKILYLDDKYMIVETDVEDGPGLTNNAKSTIASWKAEFSMYVLKAVTSTSLLSQYNETEWTVREH